MNPTPPPYAPNVVNQTVSYGGVTWKGNPGGDWYPESGGGGGFDPAGQSIMDAINKQNEAFIAKIKEFDTKNPFVYDQILADEVKKVGQRLDPYYKQTLDDFLTSVERKRTRSLEDERSTLSEISQDIGDYTKENKMVLEDALDKSREGYADAGLYNSGARMRAEGRLGQGAQDQLKNYTQGQDRRAADVRLSTGRTMEDLGEEQRLFQREVGSYSPTGQFTRGARSEAEARSQAMSEIPALQQQRQFALRQYAGAPAGVDAAQYNLETYNLLR